MKTLLLVMLIAGAYVLLYSGWTNNSVLETINISSSNKGKGKGKN